jgi:hypothetical protein
MLIVSGFAMTNPLKQLTFTYYFPHIITARIPGTSFAIV